MRHTLLSHYHKTRDRSIKTSQTSQTMHVFCIWAFAVVSSSLWSCWPLSLTSSAQHPAGLDGKLSPLMISSFPRFHREFPLDYIVPDSFELDIELKQTFGLQGREVCSFGCSWKKEQSHDSFETVVNGRCLVWFPRDGTSESLNLSVCWIDLLELII